MGKREEVRERRKKEAAKKNRTTIIIVSALVVVVIGVIIAYQLKPVGDITLPDRVHTSESNGLTLGSTDAPIQVVEFADFQCPACAAYWSQLEPQIISLYVDTGKIQYTYSPFSFLGQGQTWDESKKAAEAAYCANEQQKFWEFHDIIFANHNGENQGAYTKERLVAFAKELGLDMDAFNACFNSGKYAQTIEDNNLFATQQGATYTPSFLVDGKIVNANELVQAIEDSLAK